MSAAATPTPVSTAATPTPVSAAATPPRVSTAATPTPVSAAATPPPVLHLIDGLDDGGSIIDHRTVCRRGRTARCTGHTDTHRNKRCNQDRSHSSLRPCFCPCALPCHAHNHDERFSRRAACSSNSDQKRSRPAEERGKAMFVPHHVNKGGRFFFDEYSFIYLRLRRSHFDRASFA